jgi:hypothetical protein
MDKWSIAGPGPAYYHCLYGVTTIPQRCKKCGEHRTIKRTGDHRPQKDPTESRDDLQLLEELH